MTLKFMLVLFAPFFCGLMAGVLIRSIDARTTQNGRLLTLLFALLFTSASVISTAWLGIMAVQSPTYLDRFVDHVETE